MYEGSPIRDASVILVNWSGLSKSSDYLPNMSVLLHSAIVAQAYHTVLKGVPELNRYKFICLTELNRYINIYIYMFNSGHSF